MTKQEEARVLELGAAWKAGKSWAESLKIGDKFTGSRPAAEAAYPTDEQLQQLFSMSALDVLANYRIVTDLNGVLTMDPRFKLEAPSAPQDIRTEAR